MSRKFSDKIPIFKMLDDSYNDGRIADDKREGKSTVNDCDALMKEVIEQAQALGIPISKRIGAHVILNPRAVSRFGCCRRQGGEYIIEVATRIAEGPEKSCRDTLAHELLHTCPGCQNHGARWKMYAGQMNKAYGYNIKRAATEQAMGTAQVRPFKYLLRCERCGAELGRYRASPLTRYPERYRCRCGGRLKRVEP